jgi:hypothetical protein
LIGDLVHACGAVGEGDSEWRVSGRGSYGRKILRPNVGHCQRLIGHYLTSGCGDAAGRSGPHGYDCHRTLRERTDQTSVNRSRPDGPGYDYFYAEIR